MVAILMSDMRVLLSLFFGLFLLVLLSIYLIGGGLSGMVRLWYRVPLGDSHLFCIIGSLLLVF